jgi:biotin transport system substrate-specific component
MKRNSFFLLSTRLVQLVDNVKKIIIIMIVMKNKLLLKMAFVAVFAAIISFGGFLKIPAGVVPIVLQNVLCILAGVMLGSFSGSLPVALFLIAGLIGLPVYSGGTSGISVWIGPTGGFLPGYFFGALVAGLIAGKPKFSDSKNKMSIIRISFGIIIGMIVIYIPGVIHFSHWAFSAGKIPEDKTAFAFTLMTCVYPYISGDVIKIIVAIPVALKVRPLIAQYLFSEN